MAALLGTRWLFRSAGGGTFHCPRCDREREYSATAVRKALAVFGRPVVHLGAAETLIACDTCGAVCDVAVTTLPPKAARERPTEDERALEAVLDAMVFSDSAIRSSERQAAREAFRHYAHRGDERGEPYEVEPAKRRRGPNEAFDHLARLRGVLDDATKRRILAAAYRVCAADRELHAQEARLIVRLGDLMDLHPRQVRAAMKEGRE